MKRRVTMSCLYVSKAYDQEPDNTVVLFVGADA